MSELVCQITAHPPAVVVKLCGPLTFAEIPEFDRQMGLADSSQPAVLVLDLSEVSFMSSAGIGALVKLHRMLRGRNRTLRLAACPPNITEIFRLSRLDGVLSLAPSVDEAVRGPAA